jgi:hypothetical protein
MGLPRESRMTNNDQDPKLCQLHKPPKVKLVKVLNKLIITHLVVYISHTPTLGPRPIDCLHSSSNSTIVKYSQMLMQAIVAYILI